MNNTVLAPRLYTRAASRPFRAHRDNDNRAREIIPYANFGWTKDLMIKLRTNGQENL